MDFFCGVNRETSEYKHFFKNKTSVNMFGVSKDNIVRVSVNEASVGNGTHWAYKNLLTGKINHIFKTKIQVKLCSSDLFKLKRKEGKGEIIEVTVKEIDSEFAK